MNLNGDMGELVGAANSGTGGLGSFGGLSNSLLNCTPQQWFYPYYSTTTEYKIPVESMNIEFVSNGFILKHNGQTYVAVNLQGLFKTMGKIIEEKIEKAKEEEKKGKKK